MSRKQRNHLKTVEDALRQIEADTRRLCGEDDNRYTVVDAYRILIQAQTALAALTGTSLVLTPPSPRIEAAIDAEIAAA